jgi:hypothetical protein
MQDFRRQILLYLRARYPILYLVTHEEQRIWRELVRIAEQEGIGLYRWRSTRGLEGAVGPIGSSHSPLDGLGAFARQTESSIAVFWDLHTHLDDPAVLRQLRDLCIEMGPKGQSLVIMGPSLVIPIELEKSVAVLDVPLPTADESRKLLRVLCTSQGISIDPELFERFVQGGLGLTEEEIKRLYSRILLGGGAFSEADLLLQVQEKRKAIRRSRYLEFWDLQSLQIDVGGMDNLKNWLGERRQAFTQEARDFGLPEPKGLFLLGVQGCGKSLMAKAVAQLWKLPLLRLDVGAVFHSGGVETGLRETIRIAESLSPVVLWIDELEKGFSMASGAGGDSLGYFLTWMQEKRHPVFVVATANEVRSLPPELLRKGRFDEIFFVDLPDPHERLEIMDIHLRARARAPADFDLTLIVEDTERFSGAELEQVVVAALYRAFAGGRDIATEDLLDSAREIIPLAVTMDEQLKDLRDWARPRARRATAERRRVDFFSDWQEG